MLATIYPFFAPVSARGLAGHRSECIQPIKECAVPCVAPPIARNPEGRIRYNEAFNMKLVHTTLAALALISTLFAGSSALAQAPTDAQCSVLYAGQTTEVGAVLFNERDLVESFEFKI